MSIGRSKLIKSSLQYLSATVISQGVGLLRSIMMPILFNPGQLGLWNLANVIVGYGANAHIGLLHGMSKAIPSLRGQNDEGKIEAIKNSVFWMNLIIGIVSALGIYVCSIFNTYAFQSEIKVVAFIVLIQMLFLYMFSLLRSDARFGLLSKGLIYHSVFMTSLIITFAFLFENRILGALIGFAGAYLLTTSYWLIMGRYNFPFSMKTESLRKAFVLGFPLIILGALDSVFISVDRWLIATHLGVVDVGYYALGIMINGVLCIIPGSVASTLYPKMLERFSEAQDPVSASSLLLNPLRALAALMLILICFSAVALPLIIQFFLPKYIQSISVVRVFIFGAYLFSLSVIAGNFMVAINKQKKLMYVQLCAIVIVLIVDLLILKAGFGVLGVAIGTMVGYSFYGIAYLYLAINIAIENTKTAILFIVKLVIPYCVAIAVLVLSQTVINSCGSIAKQLLAEFCKFIVLLGFIVPTLYLVNKDGELLNIFRSEITQYFIKNKN